MAVSADWAHYDTPFQEQSGLEHHTNLSLPVVEVRWPFFVVLLVFCFAFLSSPSFFPSFPSRGGSAMAILRCPSGVEFLVLLCLFDA